MSKTAELKAEREARKAQRAAEKLEKQRALDEAVAAAKEALMPPPQPRLLGCSPDTLLDDRAREHCKAIAPEAQEHRAPLPAQPTDAGNTQHVARAVQRNHHGTEGRRPMSNWTVTATGREHMLSGPEATHPDNTPSLPEIGHSLAQINRYTGHAIRPYSVAEHSLLVLNFARADFANAELQFAALMHDAHECIVGDVSSPIKAELGPVWAAFEWTHQRHLLEQYGLLEVYTRHKHQIKRWDLMALATERGSVMRFDPEVNRPWPILDTPGHEVTPVAHVNLLAHWRWAGWKTWASIFTKEAESLNRAVVAGAH